MFFKDPVTGEPSLAFTMYVMECEGELDNEKEEDVDTESASAAKEGQKSSNTLL